MKKIFFTYFLLHLVSTGFSTHIRGGQITIEKISGLTCQITLRGFARVASVVKWEGGVLDFGDGSPAVNEPRMEIYDPSYEPSTGIYNFTISHTYPGPGFYTVSFFERNLNAGILNMTNSVDTPFYLESGFTLDPLIDDFAAATFETDPVFEFASGREFSFSTAPIDTVSRIYNYELVVPYQDAGLVVSNYVFPENLKLNAISGLLTWDTKFNGQYLVGEYLFALKISQYNKKGQYLGYVTRAFTVYIQDNPSLISISNPITDPLGKILVEPGSQKKIKVIVSDSIAVNTVFWESHFSSTLSNNITFTQYDSVTEKRKMKVGMLTITSTNDITREFPYEIILRAFSDQMPKDISFLFFTKETDLPVITSIHASDSRISVFPNPCINELFVSGITAKQVQASSVEVVNSFYKQRWRIKRN